MSVDIKKYLALEESQCLVCGDSINEEGYCDECHGAFELEVELRSEDSFESALWERTR